MAFTPPRARRNAYTLFEMVIVTAVIGMTAGLAVPVLSGLTARYRLDAGVDAVRAAWSRGRSKAIEEGRPYRFAVVTGKGNFRVAPDDASYWQGGDGPADGGWVREDALPPGVVFAAGDSGGPAGAGVNTVLPAGSVGPGSWTDVAVFQPDGTAREDVEVSFQVQGAPGKVVHLRALTGAVTVKPLGGV